MATNSAALDGARIKELSKFLTNSEKTLGVRARTLSDSTAEDIPVISTGAISLDYALGMGGIPRGRITEMYGPTGSGKTTLALSVAKSCQDNGGLIAFVDAEYALNRELTDSIGIDADRFVIVQPDNGEQAADVSKTMVESGLFDMVIVDSAAAMTPKKEIEADMEDQFMGLQARLLSRWMRIMVGPVQQHNVAFIVINQIRTNLAQYGAPDESTGGKALKFYSSVRIEVRTSTGRQIKKGSEVIGTRVKSTVKKNKFASPFKVAEYDVYFGHGIDAASGLLDVAMDVGAIEKSGNTYTAVLTGSDLSPISEKLAVGKDKALAALQADQDLFSGVEAAAWALMRGRKSEPVDAEPAALDEAPNAEQDDAATGPQLEDEDFFGLG